MKWKYAMILVDIEGSGKEAKEVCELVELYDLADRGFTTFCKATLSSEKDILMAAEDVKRDGINRWFYENGVFSLEADDCAKRWVWIRHEAAKYMKEKAANCKDSEEAAEEELYTVYGGD